MELEDRLGHIAKYVAAAGMGTIALDMLVVFGVSALNSVGITDITPKEYPMIRTGLGYSFAAGVGMFIGGIALCIHAENIENEKKMQKYVNNVLVPELRKPVVSETDRMRRAILLDTYFNP